jgi:hypothetical protein
VGHRVVVVVAVVVVVGVVVVGVVGVVESLDMRFWGRVNSSVSTYEFEFDDGLLKIVKIGENYDFESNK